MQDSLQRKSTSPSVPLNEDLRSPQENGGKQQVTTPAINAAVIQYVSTFVAKMSGESFNPHVSTGVAPKEYLDKMLAEPFETFTFSPEGAAVYQLGPFGAAAKKLKAWDLKP